MAVVMALKGEAVGASRQQEIVEEIVHNLRPLKLRKSESSVSQRIRQEINDLHENRNGYTLAAG